LVLAALPPARLPWLVAAGLGLALLAVPLYRRIVRGGVLDNPLRDRILAHVRAKAGIHESAIARDLAIGTTLAQYHVRMLVEFGLVEIRRFGGRKCVFAAGQVDRQDKTLLLAEKGRGAQVLDLVAAQPGIAQKDIARALGMRQSSAKWHLDRLEAEGLITVERSVEGKRIRLSVQAEEARHRAFARAAAEPPSVAPAALTPAATPASLATEPAAATA
jgi:predicted transcriptional regulator